MEACFYSKSLARKSTGTKGHEQGNNRTDRELCNGMGFRDSFNYICFKKGIENA